MGRLNLPSGKRVAVNLGVHFDAQCLWLGAFNIPTPSYMSRGEFGAVVGTPRLVDLFEKYDITTTWFTPGHTIDTWPDLCRDVQARGHEFAHHGYYHENPTKIERETERKLIQLGIDSFERHLNMRPRGYLSPYWDYSEATLDLIEEFGFEYDCSLMGRDLVPYRPRRWQVNWETGNQWGRASKVLEIPPNWYLDDFPVFGYVTGIQEGQRDPDEIFRQWKAIFDYAYDNVEGACYEHCVHPQVIGQAHLITMFERLIEYMASKDGTWFCTAADICDAWEDDDEDLKAMELPDARGTEQPPVGSGWR